MKERPILMSAPMVLAILANKKKETRRTVKPQPQFKGTDSWLWEGGQRLVRAGYGETYVYTNRTALERAMRSVAPYGQPGDRLWVKETFYCDDYGYPDIPESERSDEDWRNRMLYYAADGDVARQIQECEGKPKLMPSIFMPRWASRITLEVVDIRVERLWEITEKGAKAEGITGRDKIGSYGELWESINGNGSWAANPWVWVIEFKKL